MVQKLQFIDDTERILLLYIALDFVACRKRMCLGVLPQVSSSPVNNGRKRSRERGNLWGDTAPFFCLFPSQPWAVQRHTAPSRLNFHSSTSTAEYSPYCTAVCIFKTAPHLLQRNIFSQLIISLVLAPGIQLPCRPARRDGVSACMVRLLPWSTGGGGRWPLVMEQQV